MKLDTITNKAAIEGGINPNDEFYTPAYAVEPLLKYLKPNSIILCPFDTKESNFYKVLKANGHFVTTGHILEGIDFFSLNQIDVLGVDYIISNPPYSLKYEVFKKLYELNRPFAMLVGVVGLFESQKRFNLFKDNKFQVMYLDKRVSYFKNYAEQKPSLNPPFSSVYIMKNVVDYPLVFETINKLFMTLPLKTDE